MGILSDPLKRAKEYLIININCDEKPTILVEQG